MGLDQIIRSGQDWKKDSQVERDRLGKQWVSGIILCSVLLAAQLGHKKRNNFWHCHTAAGEQLVTVTQCSRTRSARGLSCVNVVMMPPTGMRFEIALKYTKTLVRKK